MKDLLSLIQNRESLVLWLSVIALIIMVVGFLAGFVMITDDKGGMGLLAIVGSFVTGLSIATTSATLKTLLEIENNTRKD